MDDPAIGIHLLDNQPDLSTSINLVGGWTFVLVARTVVAQALYMKKCNLLCVVIISFLVCCTDHKIVNVGPYAPEVKTSNVHDMSTATAIGGGEVTSDGGSPVTSRGTCWSNLLSPDISASKSTDGSGTGVFTSSINGLSANMVYFTRAYATNKVNTSYGLDVAFSNVPDKTPGVYATVTIGTQVWMAENLRTTSFNDGTPITLATAASANVTSPIYCWYDNNEQAFKNTYGALYNWYAVNTGKLCPVGWHVPTDADWTTLVTTLGGSNVAGGKLKESGFNHWRSPNEGATNSSGFNALPGGSSNQSGMSTDIAQIATWWSATEASSTIANYRQVAWGTPDLFSSNNIKSVGYSVRCVKN